MLAKNNRCDHLFHTVTLKLRFSKLRQLKIAEDESQYMYYQIKKQRTGTATIIKHVLNIDHHSLKIHMKPFPYNMTKSVQTSIFR